MEQTQKKQIQFGQIEDVVSTAALLRPTIVKAVAGLDPRELKNFSRMLIEAEKELSHSHLEFRERFERAQIKLRETYAFAPVWRFISARVEESWKNSAALTVKELSVVSLLFGIMIEETQTRLQKKSKRVA